MLRAAQAVSKAGPSFLGADLLNDIHELGRNDALMVATEEASHWNICFLDPLSKTLLILFRKAHQPPGFNILCQGTMLLPATSTTSEREMAFTELNLVSKEVLWSLVCCEKNLPGKGESQALLLAPTYLFFCSLLVTVTNIIIFLRWAELWLHM